MDTDESAADVEAILQMSQSDPQKCRALLEALQKASGLTQLGLTVPTSSQLSVEQRVGDFRPFIVGIVKASELVPHLSSILHFNLNVNSSIIDELNQSRAMWKLLDIIDQSAVEGKWRAFVQALKNAGYSYVASILEGEPVSAYHSYYIEIIQAFYPALQEHLSPIEILPELISTKVITEEDRQAIVARRDQSGDMAASMVLLDRIPRRLKPEQWYNRFLQALWNSGQRELVKEVDPDFCSRYTSWRFAYTTSQSESEAAAKKGFASKEYPSLGAMSMSDDVFSLDSIKEDLMEVSGDAERTDDNLSAPPHPSKWLPSEEKQQKLHIIGLPDPSKPIPLQMLTKEHESQTAPEDTERMEHKRARPSDDSSLTCVKKVFVEKESDLMLTDEVKAFNIPAGSASGQSECSGGMIMDPDRLRIPPGSPTGSVRSTINNEEVEELDNNSALRLLSMGLYDDVRTLSLSSNPGQLPSLGNIRQPTATPQMDSVSDAGSTSSACSREPRSVNNLSSEIPQNTDFGDDLALDLDELSTDIGDIVRPTGTTAVRSLGNFPHVILGRGRGVLRDYNQMSADNGQGKAIHDKRLQFPSGLDELSANITEPEKIVVEEPEPEEEDTDIELRDYQWELAKPAIQGKNVIIVAPTGSGKTRVALKVMQEHMRKKHGSQIPKVVFLVNQVALANQQGAECKKLLRHYKTQVLSGEVQRTLRVSLKDYIDKRNILVMTAQILQEALAKKEVDISTFSLLVFDECHHTHAKHPFNRIMNLYMDQKLLDGTDKASLPQIVGLTASVGVGKSRTVDKAVDHIKNLMANLDADEICTVRENIGQLSEFVNIPEEETCTVPRRENDLFGQVMVKVMEHIEKLMLDSKMVQEMPRAKDFLPILKAPSAKGSPQYQQWVSKLWKETAKISDPTIMKFFRSCRNHLEYYNNALMIYNDTRVKDALDYLEQEIKRWKENIIMEEIDKKLYRIYERSRSGKGLNYDKCSPNPKLIKLREMINRAYSGPESENSRGIIFVKTRNLAKALIAWMKETPGLKELRPTEFLGAHARGDKGGMTKAEQEDVLQYFRDGAHKLIVATSVAEEGLDISKCNLVIRYDHVTNEIAMVQSRGRGRAEGSKYFVLAEEGTGTAEKEELNMIREVMMRKAIIQLQDEIGKNKQTFQDELQKRQDSAKLERDLEAFSRQRKAVRDGEFELRCNKCTTFICMSTDVKKIQDAHHAVVDDTFEERVNIVKLGSPKVIDETIQFVARLLCRKCGNYLGTQTIYKRWPFPVIKIESFLIVDSVGRQDTCKKWKSVPFTVAPLTDDDLRELLLKCSSGARSPEGAAN